MRNRAGYAQNVGEERIIASGERFGEFAIRAGYVKATKIGNQFHADVKLV